MKNFSTKGMDFGMSVVNAGQRNTTEEPVLVVTSTMGGFRLTSAVTKVLGIGHGDYAMFINNVGTIDEAIANKNANLVAFCEESGLEFGSAEATTAIHHEFDVWAIAKGIQKFDKHGNPLMGKERMSKTDKVKVVENKFAEIFEAAMASENEELIAALTREGITEEEQKEILVSTVEGDDVFKYEGSKCANTSAMLGAGTTINFTDGNVWNQLKSDLDENANKVNRSYEINVDELIDITVFDGYKEVAVKAVVLGDYKDETPIRSGRKA